MIGSIKTYFNKISVTLSHVYTKQNRVIILQISLSISSSTATLFNNRQLNNDTSWISLKNKKYIISDSSKTNRQNHRSDEQRSVSRSRTRGHRHALASHQGPIHSVHTYTSISFRSSKILVFLPFALYYVMYNARAPRV